jgi:hypothetical protein
MALTGVTATRWHQVSLCQDQPLTHVWQGHYFVTLGAPLHNNVTGDSAYVVVPATMTFKVQATVLCDAGMRKNRRQLEIHHSARL